jgi:ATP-dependent DNA helicase RecQ
VGAYLQAKGIPAAVYHAGLDPQTREAAYRAFVHDEVRCVVATVAFGMGIDKSDIRFVVHMAMPKTVENYYQEIGRAGRDGLPAETLLLYSAADAAQRASLIEELPEGTYRRSAHDKLERMVAYCRGEACRHGMLADYFAETAAPCGSRCDNCTAPAAAKEEVTEEARMFLSALYRTGQRFGKHHLIDLLRGGRGERIVRFGHDGLSVHGIGAHRSKAAWEAIVERLLEIGAVARGEARNLTLTPVGAAILKGERKVDIRADRLSRAKARPSRPRPQADGELPAAARPLFEKLRDLRRRIAQEEGIPAYMVFNDRTLAQMAATKPSSEEALLAVDGVGEKKLQRYGEIFLKLLKEEKDGV